MSSPSPAPESKRPDDTAFKQQRLPAWQPVMSPPWVIGGFLLVAALFIPIGIAVIVTSSGIEEIRERYDNLRACPFDQRTAPSYACAPLAVDFQVKKRMDPPVFMYYQLSNFYQNHRRYARSRDAYQLSGTAQDVGSLGNCDPFQRPGQYNDLGVNSTVRLNNTDTVVPVADLAYYPCGLVAWSMFNDSFRLYRTDNTTSKQLICDGDNFDAQGNIKSTAVGPMHCRKAGIAWPSDPGSKFDEVPQDAAYPTFLSHRGINVANDSELAPFVANGWYLHETGHKIPDPADEDLMVWMRLASLSTFRKLYRRIDVALEPGTYRVEVDQRFDMRSFQGKKYFILTTTAWIGGRNFVLGGLYIATGAVCFLVAVAFLGKFLMTPRRLGSL